MSSTFDFGAIYGKADHSVAAPLEPGWYDAIVEEAEFGRTKDGTKGAWTIKFRTTSGDRAGYPLTMTLSINEVKQDGSPNPQGLGIMCRQLYAMGLPFPPPVGEPGMRGFWEYGVTLEQTPQYMTGKVVYIRVISDEYDGTTRSKVKDIRAGRPGAPTSVPVQQAPQPQYAANPYAGAPDWAQPQQPQQPAYQNGNGYAPQPQQPAFGGYAPQQPPQQPQPQGPVAPGPWQGAQPPAAAPQPIPGAPGWAQPGGGAPGQGGMGEPPAQGQAPWGQPPQATPQPQFQPPPPQAQQPWNGGQQPPPPAQFQQPYPQQQAPQQPAPPAPQQGAPELPPWA